MSKNAPLQIIETFLASMDGGSPEDHIEMARAGKIFIHSQAGGDDPWLDVGKGSDRALARINNILGKALSQEMDDAISPNVLGFRRATFAMLAQDRDRQLDAITAMQTHNVENVLIVTPEDSGAVG